MYTKSIYIKLDSFLSGDLQHLGGLYVEADAAYKVG